MTPASLHESLPPWFRAARTVAFSLVILQLLSRRIIPSTAAHPVVDLLWEIVILLCWFEPWIWFRVWWIWWPGFLISSAISYQVTRNVVAAWLMQTASDGIPFVRWPLLLQIGFFIANLVALFGIWQTIALFSYRTHIFRKRIRPSKKRKSVL